MATPTELFINSELPKRPYTNQFPLTAGHIPVATGNGLEVAARALTTSDISGMSSYATQQDLSNVLAGLWDDRGAYTVNAAGNINYPSSAGSGVAGALMKGDIFTVAGAVAGVSTINNIAVNNGDTVRALVDNPSATDNAHWAIAENNIGYVPENRANKTTNTDLSGATGTYPDTPTVKSYIDKYDISAASINSTGTVTLTRTASDLTFQVPTAISGLSFDANTGVLTSSYTNNATSTTITVAANEVSDNVFRIKDNDDATKKIAFQASGIAAGETRTITMPNADVNLGLVGPATKVYTSGVAYVVGELVHHQNHIWRVLVAHTGEIPFVNGNLELVGDVFKLFLQSTPYVAQRLGVKSPSLDMVDKTLDVTFYVNGASTIDISEAPARVTVRNSNTHSAEDLTITKTHATNIVVFVDDTGTNINTTSGLTATYVITLGAGQEVELLNLSYSVIVKLRNQNTAGKFKLCDNSSTLDADKNDGWLFSGTATDARTVILPDKNINLGDLPSVATTNTNSLTGARSAIVGGSNNVLNGADSVITGSEYSSISSNNSNCFIAGSRRAIITSTGDRNSIYGALGGNTVGGASIDSSGSRNLIFGSLCVDNTANGSSIIGTASDNFIFGARANYSTSTELRGNTARCTIVSSGGGIVLDNCSDSVIMAMGGNSTTTRTWTSAVGVLSIGGSLPVASPANRSSYYGVGTTSGGYSAEFILYNNTAATNIVLTTDGSGTVSATNAPNIEGGANTYDIDIYLSPTHTARVALCRRKVFIQPSFSLGNFIQVDTVGTDITWNGYIPTITITIDATGRLKISCSATNSALDPLSIRGSAFVTMKTF